MIDANNALDTIETEFTGAYTLETESEDGMYYRVRNHNDDSVFPMKKTTFKRNVENGKYEVHDDGSFSMQEKTQAKISWV